MAQFQLSDFGMTGTRGFLTNHDLQKMQLPPAFDEITNAGQHLSGTLTSGRVRTFLNQLPEVDMAVHLPNLNEAQLQLLMVRYSFLVQAYIWGEANPPEFLPRNLAVPYCLLAAHIGEFPLLPYAAYTLNNWHKLDEKGGVTLDNIEVIQNFFGGADENWFIMVHVEIEAKAAPALAAIPALTEAVSNNDKALVAKQLSIILQAWDTIQPVFARMPEQCDPYIYYNRVRPYIHGWKGNPATPDGIVYQGVEKYGNKPQAFRGQTGSQSSIVPTMDALLGIAHDNDPLREYLDELHQYRPVQHRRFIEAVQKHSKLRAFVSASQDEKLVELYNAIVSHVQTFRTQHLEYAANYINKQAKSADGNPVEVGTGGTPFMKYLKKHRDESGAHLLPLPKKSA